MAKSDEVLKLSFKGAPLILAWASQDAALKIQISWPKTMSFSQLAGKTRLNKSELDQLAWVKRSFTQMQKNQQHRQYGPHILPMLSKVDIRLHVDSQNIARLAARLNDLPLAYTKSVAESLSRQLKISLPKHELDVSKGSLINDRSLIRVITTSPVNELELGQAEFYGGSGLSWANSQSSWLDQTYGQKVDLLRRSIGSNHAPHYSIEVVTEPGRLLALAQGGHFNVKSVQTAVVTHGYELPADINDGGMMERCFDISSELYAQAQAKQPVKAQLFALWGHRQRSLIGIDQNHIQRLSSSKNNFIGAVRDKLSEKHPLFWEEWGKLG